jgi:hypothetical protein
MAVTDIECDKETPSVGLNLHQRNPTSKISLRLRGGAVKVHVKLQGHEKYNIT